MKTIDLFKTLLKFKSITPDDDGALDFISEYLSDYTAIRLDKNGVKNLFLYKKFGDGIHLNFAGHIDVVPPGEGWKSDPFDPIEQDGFIYARGAQDMKSGVAAFVNVCKEIKDFEGIISIMLTSDEEGDAKYGTLEILEYLKQENFLPDYSIVAEPTCEKVFGDAIKVGRRGSINGVLTIKGVQGHAAYPEKSVNPINIIAPVLNYIAGVNLDEGDEYFAPSKFVITDIRAGMEVTNVTPGSLKMMFNVRNSTKTDQDSIKNFLKQYFHEDNCSLSLSQSAYPFVTKSDTPLVIAMQNAIQQITGLNPKLSTSGGTSDARYIAQYGIIVAEFGVVNDTIHAPNERTQVLNLDKLYNVFYSIIENIKYNKRIS